MGKFRLMDSVVLCDPVIGLREMLRKNYETGDERTSNGLSSDSDEPTDS